MTTQPTATPRPRRRTATSRLKLTAVVTVEYKPIETPEQLAAYRRALAWFYRDRTKDAA